MIREAMRDKGMVALARVVLSKRERVIMLEPWDKGWLAPLYATRTRFGMRGNISTTSRT